MMLYVNIYRILFRILMSVIQYDFEELLTDNQNAFPIHDMTELRTLQKSTLEYRIANAFASDKGILTAGFPGIVVPNIASSYQSYKGTNNRFLGVQTVTMGSGGLLQENYGTQDAGGGGDITMPGVSRLVSNLMTMVDTYGGQIKYSSVMYKHNASVIPTAQLAREEAASSLARTIGEIFFASLYNRVYYNGAATFGWDVDKDDKHFAPMTLDVKANGLTYTDLIYIEEHLQKLSSISTIDASNMVFFLDFYNYNTLRNSYSAAYADRSVQEGWFGAIEGEGSGFSKNRSVFLGGSFKALRDEDTGIVFIKTNSKYILTADTNSGVYANQPIFKGLDSLNTKFICGETMTIAETGGVDLSKQSTIAISTPGGNPFAAQCFAYQRDSSTQGAGISYAASMGMVHFSQPANITILGKRDTALPAGTGYSPVQLSFVPSITKVIT